MSFHNLPFTPLTSSATLINFAPSISLHQNPKPLHLSPNSQPTVLSTSSIPDILPFATYFPPFTSRSFFCFPTARLPLSLLHSLLNLAPWTPLYPNPNSQSIFNPIFRNFPSPQRLKLHRIPPTSVPILTTQPLFFTAPRPFFPPPLSLPSLPLINSHAPDINQYIRFTSPKRSPNPKPPTSLSPPSPQSISTHAHPPSPSPHGNRAFSARHIPPPLPSPRTRTYPEARDIPGSASSVYPQSHPSACAIWGVVSADSRSAIHDKSQPPPGPLPYLAPLTSPRPHQTHLSTTTTPLPPPSPLSIPSNNEILHPITIP